MLYDDNKDTKLPPLGAGFLGLQNPYAEIPKVFTDVCTGTPIHVGCYKNGQNQRRIKCPKGHIAFVTENNKMRFGTIWRNPWGDFPENF